MSASGKRLKFWVVVYIAAQTVGAASIGYSQESEAQTRWKEWKAERLKMVEAKQFPRFAWASFGYDEPKGVLPNFVTYADIGFTEVQSIIRPDNLNAASAAGLNLVIGTWEKSLESEERFLRILSTANKNPAVSIVILKDEPDLKIVQGLGELNRRVIANTPKSILPLTTVLPGHASKGGNAARFDPNLQCDTRRSYCDFVNKIVVDADPSAILPTLYPLFDDGTERADYYRQLAEVRTITRDQKIGFFGFILVTSHLDGWSGKTYRRPSRADIYWQAYSLLAHNAKGLAFYQYRTKTKELGAPPLNYGEGIVTSRNSEPTEVVPFIRDLNCELSALGPLVLKLDAARTFMPGVSGQEGLSKGLPQPISRFEGQKILMSEMLPASGKDRYVLFVNTLHGKAAKETTFRFKTTPGLVAEQFSSDKKCERKSATLVPKDGWLTVKSEPGNGSLIRFYKP